MLHALRFCDLGTDAAGAEVRRQGTAVDLNKNADGSIDLDFGPTAPAGIEASNWRQTVPGKGFYPMFRFYSPKESLFDGTWKLPDVKLMK